MIAKDPRNAVPPAEIRPPPAPPASRAREGRLMNATDANPEHYSKGPRPFKDKDSRASLVPTAEWHRCGGCGTTFAAREGLRGHHRFARCPARDDSLDDVSLTEDELRNRVRRRLRAPAGGSR